MVLKRLTAFLTCVVWVACASLATGQPGADDAAPNPRPGDTPKPTESKAGGDADVDAGDTDDVKPTSADADYAWRKVAGQYIDPTSSYSLHGYVDGVFAGKSGEWTSPDPTRPSAPGHLLVPNRNNAAFQYDAALILNSSLGSGAVMIELHMVSNPSGTGTAGPGGLTIAATEVTASIDFHPTLFTVSGGLFWIPFGIVNRDWLGAEAMFTTLPRASAAFPTHWNERGVRINGAKALGNSAGINYVASVGNGVHSFAISGQPSADLDNAKTVVGRVGLFPGLGKRLELGYSFAYGKMRSTADTVKDALDTARYPSILSAHGADAVLKVGKLLASAYYIRSEEDLSADMAGAAPPAALIRQGATAQVIYDIPFEHLVFSAIAPKVRADWVSVQRLTDPVGGKETLSSSGVSFGVNLYPHKQLLRFDDYPFRALFVSLEYHVQRELDGVELDNDRFIARITGRF